MNSSEVYRTGFQTDTSKSRCDWLRLSQSHPHCRFRALSNQNQFENPPELFDFLNGFERIFERSGSLKSDTLLIEFQIQ